jgi:hypothetical protein
MKKAIANLLFVILSSSVTVLINTLEASSSTLKFSRLVTSPNDGLLIVASRLEINTAGDIYVIDGINNSLQVDERSRINDSREVYFVDGFNNNLQVKNLSSNAANNSNGRFLWSNFLVLDKNGNVYRSSRITSGETDSVYAIDGINNQLKSSGNGEAYLVDGINNSFQVTNPPDSNNSNRQFRWLRSLRINDEGNFDRSRKSSFSKDKDVYGVDGLNNQVNLDISQSNRSGRTFVFDGINNQPSETILNRGELPFSVGDETFNWIDELDLGETNTVYQFKEIKAEKNENIYFSDGFNNEVKGAISEENGNVYFVNGINNFFQIGLPSSFENEDDDGAIAPPDRDFLLFLNDFARRNESFNFPDGEFPEDFGKAFADGSNPFLEFFDGFDFSNFNNSEQNNEKSVSVPEPSLLLGLTLLGISTALLSKKNHPKA